MSGIDKFLSNNLNGIAKKIEIIAKECLRDAILEKVYESFSPKVYDRTEALLNSISSKIDLNGTICVYIDNSKLNYYSVYDYSRDVSEAVPFWVNDGHTEDGFDGFNDNFHDYKGRHYLERAEELMRERIGFGVRIEIINKPPNEV